MAFLPELFEWHVVAHPTLRLDLALSNIEKFTLVSLMIRQVAYTGLYDNGRLVEADNETAGVNDMIIPEYTDFHLAVHSFLKVLVGNESAV
jgi:hypothetical protein